MLFLSGFVISIMVSTCDLASLSLIAHVWMRGGKMDGKTDPVIDDDGTNKD